MTRLGSLLLAIALLGGCVQMRHHELGLPLLRADVPDPNDSVTMRQVMERLGPPMRLSATPGGYVMAWEYWLVTERKIGINLELIGVDFISADWGRAGVRGDFLLMSFDRQHRLLTAHLEQWNREVGEGQGVQVFLNAIEVVDIDDLLGGLPAHDWGFGSVEPLPTALNRDNRLGMGQGGIEQRGTQGGAGQHTLEMR